MLKKLVISFVVLMLLVTSMGQALGIERLHQPLTDAVVILFSLFFATAFATGLELLIDAERMHKECEAELEQQMQHRRWG
jgi:hypothetical protein